MPKINITAAAPPSPLAAVPTIPKSIVRGSVNVHQVDPVILCDYCSHDAAKGTENGCQPIRPVAMRIGPTPDKFQMDKVNNRTYYRNQEDKRDNREHDVPKLVAGNGRNNFLWDLFLHPLAGSS